MPAETFVSYAQNAEDVVLRRALRGVTRGTYLEVGANHPTRDSISRPFYDRGWSGITVEPMAELVAMHRRLRPRDRQVQAVAGPPGVSEAVLHSFAGTGLSTTLDAVAGEHERSGYHAEDVTVRSVTVDQILEEAGHAGPLHFVVVDTEGAEDAVLAGFDLRRWRPWVLVVEATRPNSTEPSHEAWEPDLLAAGYRFCLFDGLSRFYVAEEHAAELAERLSAPANVHDHWRRADDDEARATVEALTDDVVRWRTVALTRWAHAVAQTEKERVDKAVAEALEREIAAIHGTVSWRVTAPLRAARRLLSR